MDLGGQAGQRNRGGDRAGWRRAREDRRTGRASAIAGGADGPAHSGGGETTKRKGPSKVAASRRARIERNPRETQLKCRLALDGKGDSHVDTGLPFLAHMLAQTGRYAGVALQLTGRGDVEIDEHHLTEDAGIVFGQALSQALGDRAGIVRFGSAYAPLDEALSRVVVDLSRRPHCFFEDGGKLRGRSGPYATDNLVVYFNAFALHARATIHLA